MNELHVKYLIASISLFSTYIIGFIYGPHYGKYKRTETKKFLTAMAICIPLIVFYIFSCYMLIMLRLPFYVLLLLAIYHSILLYISIFMGWAWKTVKPMLCRFIIGPYRNDLI